MLTTPGFLGTPWMARGTCHGHTLLWVLWAAHIEGPWHGQTLSHTAGPWCARWPQYSQESSYYYREPGCPQPAGWLEADQEGIRMTCESSALCSVLSFRMALGLCQAGVKTQA